MARGFKVADAYIEVHVEDETKRDRDNLERNSSKWARALGSRLGSILGRGILSGVMSALGMVLKGLFQITKWMAVASAIGAVVQAAAGLIQALLQLAGLAPLIVPGILAMASSFAALKIAFSGFGTAVQAAWAGDLEKMTEAFKKMHPAAVQTVKAIVKLKPALEGLKKSVQGAFFGGLANEILALAGVYLPMLQKHLTGVAGEFNLLIKSIGALFLTKDVVKDWGAALAGVQGIIHNVLAAIAPLLDGFRHIGAVAIPILQELTKGLKGWAEGFAENMKQARESGSLADFINRGIQAARDLFALLINIWHILSPVIRAIATPEVLDAMVRLTGQFAKLVNTAQSMSLIKTFFDALGDILLALGPGIVAILAALGKALLILAPALTALGEAVSQGLILLGPTLEQAARFIGQIVVALTPILPLLAQTLGQVIGILGPALVKIAPSVVELFEAVALALGPIAEILSRLVVAAAPGIVAVFDALAKALIALLPAAEPVGKALAALLLAAAPLITWLGNTGALLLTEFATVLTVLLTALRPVIQVLGAFFTAMAERLMPVLLDTINKLAPTFTALFESLVKVLVPLIPLLAQIAQIFADELIKWMPQFIQIIQDAAPTLQQFLYLFGVLLTQTLQEIMPYLPTLASLLINVMLAFLKLTAALLPLLPSIVQLLLAMESLAIKTHSIEGVMLALQVVVGVVVVVLNMLASTVQFVVGIIQWAVGHLADFWRKVREGASAVGQALSSVPGTVRNAVGSLGNILYTAGQSVISGLWNGIKSMGAWFASNVRSFINQYIPGVVQRMLGIASPSRVMAELGRWIPAGLAAGMERNRQDVLDAATRLAMAAVPMLSLPQVPGAALATAGGPSTGGRSGLRDVIVYADLGGGVRQAVKGVIIDEPGLIAAGTDEGRRLRSFVYSPRSKE